MQKDTKDKNIFLEELDRALNTCVYFVRDFNAPKAMKGEYVRDGKSCQVDAYWDCYLIDYYLKHIDEIDKVPSKFNREGFRNFLVFLLDNKWEKDWYSPRPKRMQYMKENFSKLGLKSLGYEQ